MNFIKIQTSEDAFNVINLERLETVDEFIDSQGMKRLQLCFSAEYNQIIIYANNPFYEEIKAKLFEAIGIGD